MNVISRREEILLSTVGIDCDQSLSVMPSCIMQGSYAVAMKLVGNAVPMLLGWAILAGLFEAAYSVPAPKPAFLAYRPPWDGEHPQVIAA